MRQTTSPRRRLDDSSTANPVARVVHTPDAALRGRTLPLGDGAAWTLGREGEYRVADARLSRLHLRVTGLIIEDLSSSNGTFVNGQALDGRRSLEPNAVVRAGDTLLVVDPAPGPQLWPIRWDADPEAAFEVIGHSQTSALLRRCAATVASGTGTVLILGPTGSGKEVFARAVHRLSGRPGALVPVNCGALPVELAEAELFGHARGAFTGAQHARPGLFRQADGGTLFLDEIGEMPPPQQVKLLRALEERMIRPVGQTREEAIDVRIVAATNADLAQNGFRSDLAARLAEWVVRLPPLKDHRADIMVLWHRLVARAKGLVEAPTAELAEALLLHAWPGNVRELDRLARRAVGLARPSVPWDIDLLPAELVGPLRRRDAETTGDVTPDREALLEALTESRGNVAEVGRRFGRDRTQVYRWLQRHGLQPELFR